MDVSVRSTPKPNKGPEINESYLACCRIATADMAAQFSQLKDLFRNTKPEKVKFIKVGSYFEPILFEPGHGMKWKYMHFTAGMAC